MANNRKIRHANAEIDIIPQAWLRIINSLNAERNVVPMGMAYSPELEEIATREYEKYYPLQSLRYEDLRALSIINSN
ncbi:MAG TPA: hypothetical protein VD794_08640 [Flavisolibacter sp.]|nr:hypothetical protein [Flavisolibacter sp.]